MEDYEALTGMILIVVGICLLIIILKVVGEWKMFKKAGKEGWPALIPIYNDYILCKIVGINPWWIAAIYIVPFIPIIGQAFAPFVGIYFYVILYVSTARSYGKEDSFAVGLFLLTPIFMLILGCGDSKYLGARPMSDPIFDALGINKKEDKVQEANVVNEEKEEIKEETKEVPKNCPNCGEAVVEGSKFCVSCGKEL